MKVLDLNLGPTNSRVTGSFHNISGSQNINGEYQEFVSELAGEPDKMYLPRPQT